MDGMLSLLDTICHSDYQDSVFQAFLNACSDQQAFVNKASSAIQSIVSKINSKLSAASSRFEGLLLLKTYLPQCSIEIFGENVVSWMQLCLKAVEGGQNKYEVFDTAYQVLTILLQMSENLPDMKKPISGIIVPKIVENFQQINPQEVSLSVLECLELLMCKYGPACGQQKNVLEKCILQYVDCKESDVVKRVARCLAYLPLLGGGGSMGASHVARLNQYQQKLCATLHGILDELFDGIREVPNSYSCVTSQKLALPEMKESSPLVRVHRLITRFINISKCLQAVLISEYPVEKTIMPDAILGVVCRGLAVNSRSLGKKISPDVLMIGAMLPQVHIIHLRLLDSLVTCCRRNLLPYAPIICRLVLQTLKWTSETKWVYAMEKPYCQLREAACNSLKLWLQVSNSGSCVELIADQLVSLLIQDVWFEKESVTLIAQNSNKGKRLHIKSSGQEQITGVNVRNSKRHVPNKTANSSVCRAALQLLQWILHSAAPFLKPAIHRLLQEKTVSLLFEIQRTSNPEDLPVPFSEPTCRLELYQLLYTLNLEPHTVWPPPTQFTLYILAAGRNDAHLKVSAFCTTSLAALEKLIHPSSGTLQLPVTLEEMLDSTKNYKQDFVIPHFISNETAQREEVEEQPKAINKVQMKQDLKENVNTTEDVEVVFENHVDEEFVAREEEVEDEMEEEEEDIEGEEEEDECIESEECDSDLDEVLVTEDDNSSNPNEWPVTNRRNFKKKFKELENDEMVCVDIAESDTENEGMNNGPVTKQNDNLRKGTKINEEDRKQALSYIKCRNDLQVTETYPEDKVSNSCKKETSELVAVSKVQGDLPPDDKSNHAGDFDGVDMFNDEEYGEEEALEEEEEEIDEVDDIEDEEPNQKKIKLHSPTSVKGTKSIRDIPEYVENNIEDIETDPMKKDEEDPLQINGIAMESEEEVSEGEMIKSFVDAVAE